MKNLGTVLQIKFPQAEGVTGRFYEVRDDGKGPYIATWNEELLGARPSDEQLEEWQAEYEAAPPVSMKTQDEKIADIKVRLAALELGTR